MRLAEEDSTEELFKAGLFDVSTGCRSRSMKHRSIFWYYEYKHSMEISYRLLSIIFPYMWSHLSAHLDWRQCKLKRLHHTRKAVFIALWLCSYLVFITVIYLRVHSSDVIQGVSTRNKLLTCQHINMLGIFFLADWIIYQCLKKIL
jgi:hypothetical protein